MHNYNLLHEVLRNDNRQVVALCPNLDCCRASSTDIQLLLRKDKPTVTFRKNGNMRFTLPVDLTNDDLFLLKYIAGIQFITQATWLRYRPPNLYRNHYHAEWFVHTEIEFTCRGDIAYQSGTPFCYRNRVSRPTNSLSS